jgi:hypothetical protein
MIRLGALLWICLVSLAGFGTFELKYRVQSQEQALLHLNRQIDQDRDSIQLLRAEWAHLNDPKRLADLAQRHLDLVAVTGAQIVHFEALPPRPAPGSPESEGGDPSTVALLDELGGVGPSSMGVKR